MQTRVAHDERVQSAIEHWAPRFISNGIDFNDFQRVTEGITHWEEWCGAWSACGAMHEALGAQAEAAGCSISAGQHFLHAALAYHFGKFLFLQSPTEHRAAHQHVVDVYQKALSRVAFPGERVAIPYDGAGMLYGIFRKPAEAARPPVVILIPGLDSVKEELHAYGDDFLRRDVAVLALDGPGQGEMEFDYPLRFDYEVPIHSAITYLESRIDVDASRVGLLGVSLGGYFAPRAAAFEPRVSAAIAVAGWYSMAETDPMGRAPLLTRQAFVARLKVEDEAEARAALMKFDLRDVAEKVRCPLLVIMGRKDRVVPPEEAERLAARAGGETQLWMFADGNHVCNNIPYKYRPQQADWMRRQLYQ
jgi:2,6-dihydroxypseudooxynicotine hydrolase